MKSKIVRMGNSRGVRIPKPLLEQAGLEHDVELRVVDDGIVIQAVNPTRAGWADAARDLHESAGDTLLDVVLPTHFDDTEWEWE